MVDLHTHILPGMDDGAKDVDMSLAMLRMEQEQGIDTVVLTPHFYRDKETPEHFLARRQTAFTKLQNAIENQEQKVPELFLGAEIAWVPHMSEWEELPQLCIGESRYFLLELPFSAWKSEMFQDIYDVLFEREIVPIFAHLERYLKIQKKDHIREILEMGTPVQVSSAPCLHFGDRRQVLNMLKKGQAQLMASDCHNLTTRPPNLRLGLDVVAKKLGAEMVRSIESNTQALGLGNSTDFVNINRSIVF